MFSKKYSVRMLIFISISVFLTACITRIKVPEAHFEQLFGTWRWVKSISKLDLGGVPEQEKHTFSKEFKRNGTEINYQDGKKMYAIKFRFVVGTSPFQSSMIWLLKYKSEVLSPCSFKFKGDSLFLRSEDVLGQINVYVKEK